MKSLSAARCEPGGACLPGTRRQELNYTGCCHIKTNGCDVAVRSSVLTLCRDQRQAALFRLFVIDWTVALAQQG